jgi:hypothetical protein
MGARDARQHVAGALDRLAQLRMSSVLWEFERASSGTVNEASGGGQRRAVCSLSSGTGADERRLQEEAVGSSGRQAL